MKKLKIVYFNGSKRVNGEVNKSILKLLEQLKLKISYDIETINLSSKMYNIKICNGCLQCFHSGQCSINDSIDIIKNKILSADLIIFATPVYVGTVSGTMKNFLDRLSCWTHTQPLLGKRSIIIVVTQNSGSDDTIKYLYKVVNYFGLDVIGILGINKNNNIYNSENQLDLIVDRYMRIIYYDETSFPNTFRNGIFENLKYIYKLEDKLGIKSYEIEYWKSKGYFNKKLSELLDNKL